MKVIKQIFIFSVLLIFSSSLVLAQDNLEGPSDIPEPENVMSTVDDSNNEETETPAPTTITLSEFESGYGLGKSGVGSGYASGIFSGGLEVGVGTIIGAVLSLIGVIFLVLLIFGGIQWMIAGGNEESVKKAQNTIKNSITGLVVVLLAYAITYFIVSRFSGPSNLLN